MSISLPQAPPASLALRVTLTLALLASLLIPATSARAVSGDGSVSGTVTVPGGHDVTGVDLYLASSDGSSIVAGPVNPDGAGAYGFTTVTDGDYTVFAETPGDTLAWQWAGAGRDVSEASTVTVSGGVATTGVDFALVVGASISGTITVPDGYSPEDSAGSLDRPSGSARLAPTGTFTAAGQYNFADSAGNYEITRLPALTWIVRFATNGQWLATEYYDDAFSEGAATTVSPSQGEALTGINATLEESHNLRIGGTFKDAGSSLCYAFHNADSSITGSDCTEPGVSEVALPVRGGDYIVSAYESNATHGDTTTLWWNDTASDQTVEANATAFTPDPLGADLAAIASFDFTGLLWPGDPIPGGINFSLTNWSDDSPATGGCMEVYDASQVKVGEDCSGYSGSYRAGPFDDGSYRVKFAGFDGAAPTQYYGPASTLGGGTVITISSSTFTGSARLLEPRSFFGSVVDSSAQPLTGGYVDVWDSSTYAAPVTRVAVDADGKWATGQLSCTSCLVRMTGFSGLAGEWWGWGSPTSSAAAQAILTSGSYPVGLSAHTLDLVPGVLSGTIVKPTSFVGDTTCVVLYESGSSGRPLGTECGNAGDSFEFDGLPAANYGVCVADTADPAIGCTGSSYLWDFVGGATPGAATTFAVTASSTTTPTLTFGGMITTSATDLLGASVTGGCVDAYAATTSALLGTDCTDDAGTYAVDVGADSNTVGSYRLHFRGFSGYADQWYSGAASLAEATAVSVEAGATTALPAVALLSTSTDGSINFDLTNWDGGTAATGGCMRVYDGDDVLAGEDCTGATGTYAVTGLGDGFYRVLLDSFDGAAPTQWYGPASTFAAATPITIAGGTDFSGSYTVLEPSSIVGAVVDGEGAPLTGGYAEIWNGYVAGFVTRVAVAGDGTFSTGAVACTSSCIVRFTGFAGLGDQWYHPIGGVGTSISASRFSPSAGAPTVLHTTMLSEPEGVLTGTIVAPASFSSADVCVVLYEERSSYVLNRPLGSQCGERGDSFEFDNLAAATYALCVVDASAPVTDCTGTAYAWDFYGEKNAQHAVSISVDAGATTVSALSFGGTLVATPAVAGGGPLSGGCMDVYASSNGPLVGSDCEPVDGSFSVSLADDSDTVPGGQYRVAFRGFIGGVDEWYNNASTQQSAWGLALRAGETVSLPIVLDPWGTVAGTISLPEGVSPEGACVLAFDAAGSYGDGPVESAVCSDPDTGAYSLALPPGAYDLLFYGAGTGAATEWYDGAPSRLQATSVAVTSGATTTVDATLSVAAQISGTVSLAGGGTASDGKVEIYTTDGYIVTEVAVDGSGHYAAADLPAGSYKIYFTGYGSWAGHYYEATNFWSDAAAVTVAAGESLVVDTTLDAAATLSGTITGPGGGSVAGVARSSSTSGARSSWTSARTRRGTTRDRFPRAPIGSCSPGSSMAAASRSPPSGTRTRPTYRDATPITVVAGGSATVDAELAAGGALTGVTKRSGAPNPLALYGCVAARDPGDAVTRRLLLCRRRRGVPHESRLPATTSCLRGIRDRVTGRRLPPLGIPAR